VSDNNKHENEDGLNERRNERRGPLRPKAASLLLPKVNLKFLCCLMRSCPGSKKDADADAGRQERRKQQFGTKTDVTNPHVRSMTLLRTISAHSLKQLQLDDAAVRHD
jgi:hypothetical protein